MILHKYGSIIPRGIKPFTLGLNLESNAMAFQVPSGELTIIKVEWPMTWAPDREQTIRIDNDFVVLICGE